MLVYRELVSHKNSDIDVIRAKQQIELLLQFENGTCQIDMKNYERTSSKASILSF